MQLELELGDQRGKLFTRMVLMCVASDCPSDVLSSDQPAYVWCWAACLT